MCAARSAFPSALLALFCVCLLFAVCGTPARAATEPAEPRQAPQGVEPWRIRFLEAAVVKGETVRLGEVAVPIGDMPAGKWDLLAARELWPSPLEGRAVNMTRPRLLEAVMRTMRDLAPYCLFPGSMALQRGGVLVGKEAIQHMVQSELTPYLASLPGETALTDFRLPHYVFMAHSGQQLTLEQLKKATPGRISLR